MGEDKLRVGMIGAGSWARRHLEAWKENGDAEVVGIWNRTAVRAKALSEEFAIPRVEEDVGSLIHATDVDIISISMPHNLHYPLSIKAIKAGKHVFCEKPLAMNLREANDMWNEAERAGVKAGIQFSHRIDPTLMHLHDLVNDGYLGSIQHAEVRMCVDSGWRDGRFPLVWRLDKSIAGAGALGDLGVYAIDMARWLVGEISHVCATAKTFISKRPTISDKYNLYEAVQMATDGTTPETGETGIVDNDDECNIIVSFSAGAHGFIRASRFHADQGLKICGSRGEVRWDAKEGKLMGMIEPADTHSEICVPEVSDKQTIVSQFVSNIINDTDSPPTFFDGLKAQEVMEAAMLSAEEKKYVSLPMPI